MIHIQYYLTVISRREFVVVCCSVLQYYFVFRDIPKV